jgi:hypothetical protein
VPSGASARRASGQLLQAGWGTRGSALCGAGRGRGGRMHTFIAPEEGENDATAPPRARLSWHSYS